MKKNKEGVMDALSQLKSATFHGALLKRSSSEIENNRYINPIEIALPALVAVSGSPAEVNNYYTTLLDDLSPVKRAFKSVLYHTANKMFLNNPKLGDLVLNNPAVKKKLHLGPIGRLEYPDKVTRVLGLLMVDINYFLGLRKKGNMDWDDGTYEAAMAIAYGWRRSLPDKVKLLQSTHQIDLELRSYLRTLKIAYPDQPLIEFINHRYKMAWYLQNKEQQKNTTNYFQSLSKTKGTKIESKMWQLLGHSSLVDYSLRYSNPEIGDAHIHELEQNFDMDPDKKNAVLLAKAKLAVYKEDTVLVKKMASKIAAVNNRFYKTEALNLYYTIGDSRKVSAIKKQLKLN